MEENLVSLGERQEILLSDSDNASIVMAEDDGGGDAEEEFSFLVVDKPVKMIVVGSESSSVMEAMEVGIEDEAVTAEEMNEEDSAGQSSFSSASSTEEEEAVTAEEETSDKSPLSTEEEEEEEEEVDIKSSLFVEKEENECAIQSPFSSSEGEKYSPTQSESTKEEEVEEEEEEVTGKSTESSEETGSSMETNEAIWPAEMIDASLAEHRRSIINYHNSGEIFGQRDTTNTQVQESVYSEKSSDSHMLGHSNRNPESSRMINDDKETQELVMVVHDGKHHIWWQIAFCLFVLPLLLLLLANWIITPKYSF